MADIEIDETTKGTLADLAADAGLSVTDYLARLAVEKRRELALSAGGAIFRETVGNPDTLAAFDAEYGGPSSVSHDASRAA